MAQSAGLHEPADSLSSQTIDRHRAITSLQEELEAIDWYDQRVEATADPELAALLAHNRDEEKEHAVMTLEWLRRHDPVLDKNLRTYLFTTLPVTEVEHEGEAKLGESGGDGQAGGGGGQSGGGGGGSDDTDTSGSLGLGSLKGQTL